MRWLDQLQMRLRLLFGRRSAAARLDDELRFHLDQQIEENRAAGMSDEEARCAALRIFGNPTLLREQTRGTWSWNGLESFVQDLRIAARSHARRPSFAATVIGTMALGIGAATAMFTVVDHVLLRPVTYRDPSHLMLISESDITGTGKNSWNVPWLDAQAWNENNRSFEQIAVSRRMLGQNYLEGESAALQVSGIAISSNLFSVLGVRPLLGPGFIPEPPTFAQGKNAGTIVLSYAAWKSAFAGEKGIIGKAVKINDSSYTVVAVMPSGFRYPAQDAAVPQVWTAVQLGDNDRKRNNDTMNFGVLARIAPGSTLASARNEISLLQRRLSQEFPEVLRKDHSEITIETYSSSLVDADERTALLALLAASGVLWLIASLNVTNLLLARSMTRQRETAMRVALGASRRRIAQQMLVEGFALNSIAALIGIGLAVASVKILAYELRQTLPISVPSMPDSPILLVLLGLTLISTLVSTAWPAWLAARAPVEPALKQGGLHAGTSRRQHRVRSVLVGAEIAMSLVLLVTCGLLLRTIYTLRHVSLGFRTDHIVVAHLGIPAFRFENKNLPQVFYAPMLDRVQHLHGVESAGLMTEVPLGHTFNIQLGLNMGGKSISAMLKPVSPEIQPIFGFKMLAGRYFAKTDTPSSELVAVVNPAFARFYAPDQHDLNSILNSKFKFWSLRQGIDTHIVGVIDNQRQASVSRDSRPEVEICLCQLTPDSGMYQPSTVAMDLAVRTERPTSEMIPALRHVLRQASPELGSANFITMDQIVEDSYGSQQLAAHLLEIFGGSALILCIGGLYGLLAYVVSQRTRELGVRIALGASRPKLLWMVIRQASVMLLGGVATGIGLAFAAGKLVTQFLYGVSPYDGWTMAAAPALLLATGLVAAYLPARRAANVDPMEALRAE